MIISHKHKFIFVRTRKVASSSMEIMLADILDKSDFATRQSDREKQTGEMFPDFDSRVFAGFDKRLRPILPFGHAPVSMAYRLFGHQVADYTVFSIDRNPWDRAISTFYWSARGTDIRTRPIEAQQQAFRDYLRQAAAPGILRRWFSINAHRDISQRWLYCIDDTPMVDVMLRYENLEQDLEQLSDYLGLPQKLSIADIHAKRDHRATSSRDLDAFYDEETRALVSRVADWEVTRLGYSYDGGVPPAFQPDPARNTVKERYLARVSRG
ncbi:sulfotransferase family 2 domain-containing protein [Aliiroseovarius subalbicans]|uniref:sulfotransferase family 2 domain-containing protein n=1 Tax=Aliiroseovarius subalbicans TaxID=2925840 RepID=UPI001F5930EF|nr:sulfotransferase family 2 domain-containing protein [Aliiroseovarius subalbicans]MCI2398732.1 sulfotransferase family protein [Aliiroseovarius subalbicans]